MKLLLRVVTSILTSWSQVKMERLHNCGLHVPLIVFLLLQVPEECVQQLAGYQVLVLALKVGPQTVAHQCAHQAPAEPVSQRQASHSRATR